MIKLNQVAIRFAVNRFAVKSKVITSAVLMHNEEKSFPNKTSLKLLILEKLFPENTFHGYVLEINWRSLIPKLFKVLFGIQETRKTNSVDRAYSCEKFSLKIEG